MFTIDWGLCNDDINLVKSVGHGEFGGNIIVI